MCDHSRVEKIADGIWTWRARHPDWHPRTPFGARVTSYALHVPGATVLVDPLAPDGDVGSLLTALADIVRDAVRIHVTIPYHIRDSEPLWAHYARAGDARILGHPAVARRLRDASGFQAIHPGETLDTGIVPIAIGNPRRYEMPLWVPARRALVLGDSIVEEGGRLRVWIPRQLTPQRITWYRERLRPSLLPLLVVDAERVLVTHGEAVAQGGRAALQAALDADPWYHRPT